MVSTSRPEVTGERAQVALALADDVVARALAAGATEAEALVTAEDAALTRFANSEIHQNVVETNIGVNLRFCVGRRIAVAATGRTDDDGLLALVERAATIAASVEELEDWGGLPGTDGRGTLGGYPAGYAEATASASPEFRAEGARAVIAAADAVGVLAYGSFSTSREGIAVANSAGIRAAQERTSSQLLTVHMSPDALPVTTCPPRPGRRGSGRRTRRGRRGRSGPARPCRSSAYRA